MGFISLVIIGKKMKLYLVLFTFLYLNIYSQTYFLDEQNITKIQQKMSELSNEFVAFDEFLKGTNDALQDRIIMNTLTYYFLIDAILDEVYILAEVQNYFVDEFKRKDFNHFNNSRIEYCITRLNELRTPLLNLQNSLKSLRVKDNINEHIALLNNAINELENSKK